MSRFTGPRVKAIRAVGCDLPGLTGKSYDRRPYPPGQHGHGRKKYSEYKLRLIEKQKLRFNYGVTERQLRRLLHDARRSKTATTDKLLELLERRLDSVVFRAGFARTIPAARQLVNHGHVLVGGSRVDIPSYRLSPGQNVTLRVPRRMAPPDGPRFEAPHWLEVDREAHTVVMKDAPTPDTMLFPVNAQLVVEFYS